MINLGSITNEITKNTMENCHTFLIILTESGSGKTNALINLINEQHDIDKIYLYARDLSKPKYQFLIKKREDTGIRHLNDPNAFIEYSNAIDVVYENINDYNLSRERKILIVLET